MMSMLCKPPGLVKILGYHGNYRGKYVMILSVGWMVVYKKLCERGPIWRVFADVIKLRILRPGGHSGVSKWVLNAMISVL